MRSSSCGSSLKMGSCWLYVRTNTVGSCRHLTNATAAGKARQGRARARARQGKGRARAKQGRETHKRDAREQSKHATTSRAASYPRRACRTTRTISPAHRVYRQTVLTPLSSHSGQRTMECTLRLSYPTVNRRHDCSLAPFVHGRGCADADEDLPVCLVDVRDDAHERRACPCGGGHAGSGRYLTQYRRTADALPTQYLSGTGERTRHKPSLEQANARGRRKPCGLI